MRWQMMPIRPSLEETCPKPEGWISLAQAVEMTGRGQKEILKAIGSAKIPALMGYWNETTKQEWRIDPDALKDWASNEELSGT